ncbi:MAG: hypothetical protein L0H79_19400 [Intrasporangium sp.]|uniref:hypothetical protein n=1 Tax=Intrasporangium sp. TaxID=1925024 RepID=UPI002647351A|nr:hypothetical protein [Intrasporangium sp.]MDN5797892.1 hypothetical protein [Intrasporangium sp.]
MHDSNGTPHLATDARVLARVAELLGAAARRLWERAETEGPFGEGYSTAQDLHLAADFAAGLLPPTAEGHDGAARTAAPEDTVAALAEAEALLRSVPIESLPAGTSQLLVRVADLTRQVRG